MGPHVTTTPRPLPGEASARVGGCVCVWGGRVRVCVCVWTVCAWCDYVHDVPLCVRDCVCVWGGGRRGGGEGCTVYLRMVCM